MPAGKKRADMPGYAEQTVNKKCADVTTAENGQAKPECPCGQQCEANIKKKVGEDSWLRGLTEGKIEATECSTCITAASPKLRSGDA